MQWKLIALCRHIMTNFSKSHLLGKFYLSCTCFKSPSLPAARVHMRGPAPVHPCLERRELIGRAGGWLTGVWSTWKSVACGAYQRCGLWNGVKNSETSRRISLRLSLRRYLYVAQSHWIYEKKGIVCEWLRRDASRYIGLSQSQCCGRLKGKDDRLIAFHSSPQRLPLFFPARLFWTRYGGLERDEEDFCGSGRKAAGSVWCDPSQDLRQCRVAAGEVLRQCRYIAGCLTTCWDDYLDSISVSAVYVRAS